MAFLKGFLLGMILQLSIGPVCLAVLSASATRGIREALQMTWGVALVDGMYILASFLGMAALFTITIVRTVIVIVGAAVLIYFGIRLLIAVTENNAEQARERKSSFGYGIALTLANPLTIVFWSSLFGSLIASGKLKGAFNDFVYSLGCITATIFFLGLVATGGAYLSRHLNKRRIRLLNIGVGLFLICFGLSMAFPLLRIPLVMSHF